MKEFIAKLIDRLEEKVKVTSLEIIVTGKKDKPYFEIKYKEVGKEGYSIGYGSYDLSNVFGWKDGCFEVVNQLAEEFAPDTNVRNAGWILVSEGLPKEAFGCLATVMDCEPTTGTYFENILPYHVGYDGETWNDGDGNVIPFEVIAWQPLPQPFARKDD